MHKLQSSFRFSVPSVVFPLLSFVFRPGQAGRQAGRLFKNGSTHPSTQTTIDIFVLSHEHAHRDEAPFSLPLSLSHSTSSTPERSVLPFPRSIKQKEKVSCKARQKLLPSLKGRQARYEGRRIQTKECNHRDRQTDRQTDRETDRQTDRQTGRHCVLCPTRQRQPKETERKKERQKTMQEMRQTYEQILISLEKKDYLAWHHFSLPTTQKYEGGRRRPSFNSCIMQQRTNERRKGERRDSHPVFHFICLQAQEATKGNGCSCAYYRPVLPSPEWKESGPTCMKGKGRAH